MQVCRRVCIGVFRRHPHGYGIRKSHHLHAYTATNEPILGYLGGSDEKKQLEEALKKYEGICTEVPVVIGDEELTSDNVQYQVAPFDHKRKVAKFYYATPEQIKKAIDVSLKVRKQWERRPLEERCEIFLKAADLIAGKYRMDIMAATMLGQGKTIVQGEIDAACELIDFYRFDVQFALEMSMYKPICPEGIKNSLELRGVEGFWAAIAPFNFTAIGGHLAGAPALMGNVVLLKPSDTAILSNYLVFKVLREAGVPPGVINFVPSDGPVFGDVVTNSPDLAGIDFTGSLKTFQTLWQNVAKKLLIYKSFPKVMGECGGKNFHFVHNSANVDDVVHGTIRSAFEYSGQKCSACSRMYVPQSMWPEIKTKMLDEIKQIKVGSPLDVENFLSAVIDDKSFARIKGWIDYAKSSSNLEILTGGTYDDSVGYFIQPTIIQCADPHDKIMKEEIFGPVLSVYVYEDEKYKEALEMMESTTPYALTGAVFAQDKSIVAEASDVLRQAAGNFYVNDKSTGSVVNQQPFGGSRLSGTNDKPGSLQYLTRFISALSVKESLVKQPHWSYQYMKK